MTTFTAGAQNTLPIWIFGNIRLGQQLPQVNVVVFVVIVLHDHPGRARAAADARAPASTGRRLIAADRGGFA